ncbi:hypothetical protein D3C79_741320 [compost metagenome]
MAIAGPLRQQIGKQRELIAEAALPLLALLAGEHGIGLLQPAEPKQGTEHPGPGRSPLLLLPLPQRTEQALGQRLVPTPFGQLLQGRPVSGHLVGERATEPRPLGGQPMNQARELGGAGGSGPRQRPTRLGFGVEQSLQGKMLEQQLLPRRACVRQQAMGIWQVQQAQQLGALVIGRDLTHLPQTEFAHQGLRHLLAGDRWHPRPVRHGALPCPYR